ncbi:stealth family protein [Williamsia sp. CHRR-6]|uniref:stealth family protein n=1 Tax=Williamsia sp. CHRR-6 TaxID=2835871 RepID=UPI001BDB2225|nr:stealth family protein [Williamsia sp. CHRR-6]MBT0567126.1 stealth family protein [Williamsia sp. CHRR-6]
MSKKISSPAPGSLYLVPPTPGAVTDVRDRGDLIADAGRLALPIGLLTPDAATVADLLLVHAVLDAAGVAHMLVRGNDRRPVLAVDRRLYPELQQALVAGCRQEPFYAKTVDDKAAKTVLIADGVLSQAEAPTILRVFRPRVDVASGLRYGADGAVQIELWTCGSTEIVAPVENSLTRRTMAADEVVFGTVRRYGVDFSTIESMFDPQSHDIDFDIDIVFSWVDGTSAAFQAQRATRMQSYVVGYGDDSAARYRQIDELRYALRSVHMYAPWIRRIFIATDSPVPDWLDEHAGVTVVRSSEFFADAADLPTHNSQAVEAQIHHIPGLSEHFLYSNDDMFFARAVDPQMFFSPGGVSMFIEADERIGLGASNSERSGFENAARVNRQLLQTRLHTQTTRHLEHVATPLRRSVLSAMEREFGAEFSATAASTFRSRANISVTNSLYHYHALGTGAAVVQRNAKARYIDTTTVAGLRSMDKLLPKRAVDFFCLNDGSFPEVDLDERARAVTAFLKRYFPIPAPWERS